MTTWDLAAILLIAAVAITFLRKWYEWRIKQIKGPKP